MMRKIIVSEFMTLDGVVEAPGGESSLGSRSGWTVPYVSDEFGEFKQEPGRDILVFGSVELARWLADRSLVDEWRLLVYPVLLGTGKRLFAESGSMMSLSLLETRVLDKGLVLQRYARGTESK